MNQNKQLLIVSNTPSPNTQTLADAAARGASHSDIKGITVKLRTPFETTADDVINSDAILMGTTENFGYMSGALKDFFEAKSLQALSDSLQAQYQTQNQHEQDEFDAMAALMDELELL